MVFARVLVRSGGMTNDKVDRMRARARKRRPIRDTGGESGGVGRGGD
jgi:hypothetical protein